MYRRHLTEPTSARPRFWCPRWSPDFGQRFLGFDLDPVVGKARNSKITRDEESNPGDNHSYINYKYMYITLYNYIYVCVCVKKSKLITLVLCWFILLSQGNFVPSNTFGLSGLWVRLLCRYNHPDRLLQGANEWAIEIQHIHHIPWPAAIACFVSCWGGSPYHQSWSGWCEA